MTLGALLLAFILMILLPVTGILAGIISWHGFRSPSPTWWMVGVAVAVLLVPYILTAMVAGRSGLDLAVSSPHPLGMISKLVALGILVATVRRWHTGGGR